MHLGARATAARLGHCRPVRTEAPSGSSAKLPWKGVGWYRKSFKLDRDEGDRVYLDFDGVMAFPKVYVNGKLAGEWDYGYTSFRIDATPFVNLQGRNVVAVRVDTTNHGTRWYPGAGIYRKVTLELRRPVHSRPVGRVRHDARGHRRRARPSPWKRPSKTTPTSRPTSLSKCNFAIRIPRAKLAGRFRTPPKQRSRPAAQKTSPSPCR